MTLGRRGEGEITALLIVALVIGMFTVSLVSFGRDVDQVYDTGFEESKFGSLNTISEIQRNTSLGIAVNLEEGSGEITAEGNVIEGQAKSAFESFKTLLNTPNIMVNLFIDLYNIAKDTVKLDPQYVMGMIAIVMLLVIASGMALFFKLKP